MSQAVHHGRHDSLVAHHFDNFQQQYSSVMLGMWTFLATEVLFFGGMFTAYIVYRWVYPEAFAAGSRNMNVTLGTINTFVLLTSSLTVALAVRASQLRQKWPLVGYLGATGVLALIFLGIKASEYAHELHVLAEMKREGLVGPSHVPHEQIFIHLYFSMTGLHAFHMIIGLGVMLFLIINAARGRYTNGRFTPIEVFGLYWHFVDLVWIFLFPMLYLIDRT